MKEYFFHGKTMRNNDMTAHVPNAIHVLLPVMSQATLMTLREYCHLSDTFIQV